MLPGALLVAWSPDELSKLESIAKKADNNGVPVSIINSEKLYQMEPALMPGALGACHVPGNRKDLCETLLRFEYITLSLSLSLSLLHTHTHTHR